MIRYSLKCDQDHDFESWFASASAYDLLHKAGHVACPTCGSALVEKALMAPAVSQTTQPVTPPSAIDDVTSPALGSAPTDHLAKLRREVEENSDYVGDKFVAEARAMHDGDAPTRPIWGEAKLADAKALVDDGVPVAPLPFIPKTKTN